MSRDVQCAVGCGVCCDRYWYQAFGYEDVEGLSECLHLTDKGCALRREDRPAGCTEYVCALGHHAKRLEEGEIRQILEASLQEIPAVWPYEIQQKTRKGA